MEIRRFFILVRKWFWLILVGTLLVTGFTYLISRSMSPVYEASAMLLDQQVFPTPGGEYAALMASQNSIKTYTELAKSTPILEEAANRLGPGFTVSRLQNSVSAGPIADTQLLRINAQDTNPEVAKNIANQLAEVFTKRNTEIRQRRFEDTKRELDRQIASIDKEIDYIQSAISALGDPKDPKNVSMPEFVRSELAKLESNLIKKQTLHTVLLRSAEDFRMASARYANNLVISSLAETPRYPVRPKVLTNTLMAMLVGFLCSVGLAFVMEYLDDTIKTADDVSQHLGYSTLGNLGRVRGRNPDDKLIAGHHPQSPLSEGYRTLRTNLQFSTVDRPLHTLLITSPNPEEGKSVTCANLGVVLAQAGLSVVIVDSDLRRPTQHRLFELPNNVGLTTLLLQEEFHPDGYLQPTKDEKLRVLTSGPLPPNPSELLSSQRMGSLIEQLRGLADMIILDSSPVLAVTDASVLARQADGTLLVLEAGSTRRDVAVRACDDLKKIGAHILGVALNKMTPSGDYYYHYYYSSDGERHRRRPHRSPLKLGWWPFRR